MRLYITRNGKKVANAQLCNSFKGFIEIYKLEVLKDYRNKGFAKKLLNKIIAKYDKLVLIVEPLDHSTNREDLIRLYSGFGFKFRKHDFGDCIKIAMVLEKNNTQNTNP